MAPNGQPTPCVTRQFLAAMCAKANSQSLAQAWALAPYTAVGAQANLDLHMVLDLLRYQHVNSNLTIRIRKLETANSYLGPWPQTPGHGTKTQTFDA